MFWLSSVFFPDLRHLSTMTKYYTASITEPVYMCWVVTSIVWPSIPTSFVRHRIQTDAEKCWNVLFNHHLPIILHTGTMGISSNVNYASARPIAFFSGATVLPNCVNLCRLGSTGDNRCWAYLHKGSPWVTNRCTMGLDAVWFRGLKQWLVFGCFVFYC